jgi:Leucine-rich repeat (LRR) protein
LPCSLHLLALGANKIREVPEAIGSLSQLQALNLCDNRIEKIPSSIARLHNLKSLSLHKNLIRTLPPELVSLRNLTELSLRENPLVERFVQRKPNISLAASAATCELTLLTFQICR